MPLLRFLTWMRIYRKKALLYHLTMIIISLGTLFLEIVPFQTLTKGGGFLHLCVGIPAYIHQSRVYMNPGIWV